MHRTSGACINGARAKTFLVGSKAEYSILLAINYMPSLSSLLMEKHQSCMHTCAHTHRESEKERDRNTERELKGRKENPYQAVQLLIDLLEFSKVIGTFNPVPVSSTHSLFRKEEARKC